MTWYYFLLCSYCFITRKTLEFFVIIFIKIKIFSTKTNPQVNAVLILRGLLGTVIECCAILWNEFLELIEIRLDSVTHVPVVEKWSLIEIYTYKFLINSILTYIKMNKNVYNEFEHQHTSNLITEVKLHNLVSQT